MATTSASGIETPGAEPGRRRPRRLLWRSLAAFALVLVLALLAGAGFGFWRFDRALHASYPQTSGSLRIGGLSAPVSVDRDSAGIPQVYASTSADLFLAEGYVEAQDRFWQMDVSRHYAAGTLASVLGHTSLAHDELARALGFRRIATQSYGRLQPQTKAYLAAYAQGVNDYLAQRPGGSALSVEYSVLGLPDTHTAAGYRPAAWSPIDSLSWLEAAAWDADVAVGQVVSRSLLADTLTNSQIDALYPENGADTGFDAWAVSGKLTASGAPLLAAAPVASPALPSAWYQIGMHCAQVDAACPYDMAGYTQPGVPGVLIGHDRTIAWSWTGKPAHASDLYLEQVSGSNYLYDGREQPLTEHQETFDVADGSPVTITVRATRHGPLLSDVSSVFRQVGQVAATSAASAISAMSANSMASMASVISVSSAGSATSAGRTAYGVALQSAVLVPNTTADSLFALDQAADWSQFAAAAAGFTAPAEGMVYADTAGNIGYQGPAALPERVAADEGNRPVPGWISAYEWTAAPGTLVRPVQEYNPAAGYIAGTPGRVMGERAQRIASDLQQVPASGHKLAASDLAGIQGDAYDPEAAILVPYLLRVKVDDFTSSAVALLKGWDYTEPAGSSAAAYYNAVWAEMLKLMIGEQLPQDESAEQLSVEGSARWDAVVNPLLSQPNSTWWGKISGKGNARDALLADALEKARLDLTALMGKSVSTWTWGRVHTLTPANQALGVGPRPALVKWLLDGDSLGLPGGGSDVATAAWNVDSGGFAVGAAPALRMVVDLAALDDSRWIGQTGESGHVDDPDYLDQASLWAAGETRAWPYSSAAVGTATAQRLQLDPQLPGPLDPQLP